MSSLAQRIEAESNDLFRFIGGDKGVDLTDMYANLRQLIFDAAKLEHDWQEEHDERVRLEEWLKASEAQVQTWREMAMNCEGGCGR